MTKTQELEVVAWEWRPEDMEVGRSYESKNFGLVTYRGIDNFHGDKTFSFDVGRGQMRYTKRLNEFLSPRQPTMYDTTSAFIIKGLQEEIEHTAGLLEASQTIALMLDSTIDRCRRDAAEATARADAAEAERDALREKAQALLDHWDERDGPEKRGSFEGVEYWSPAGRMVDTQVIADLRKALEANK